MSFVPGGLGQGELVNAISEVFSYELLFNPFIKVKAIKYRTFLNNQL